MRITVNAAFLFVLTVILSTFSSRAFSQQDDGNLLKEFEQKISAADGSKRVPIFIGMNNDELPIRAFIPANWFKRPDPSIPANLVQDKRRILIIGGIEKGALVAKTIQQNLLWFDQDPTAATLRKKISIGYIPSLQLSQLDGVTVNGKKSASKAASFPPKGAFYKSKTDRAEQYLWRFLALYPTDCIIDLRTGDKSGWYFPAKVKDESKQKAWFQSITQFLTLPASPNSQDTDLASAISNHEPINTGTISAARYIAVENETPFLKKWLSPIESNYFPKSKARIEMEARQILTPTQVAKNLAKVYGHKYSVSYIPALAIMGRCELARKLLQPYPDDVTQGILSSYVLGQKKLPEKPKGAQLSGHLVFAYLYEHTKKKEYEELYMNAAYECVTEGGKMLKVMPGHNEMSDAIFMGGPILAYAGRLRDDRSFFVACAQHMQTMSDFNLKKDGLHQHSPLDPTPWGRGNGFVALGLSLSLEQIPQDVPEFKKLLSMYQHHMLALSLHQDPTGCWHQVVDFPGSYREFTSTCMIATSMQKGIRHGWLDAKRYQPIVDQAWHDIKRRISADGILVDVCQGTGKQKSRAAYFERTATFGKDDRGGAMALLFSTELMNDPKK